MSLAIGEEDNIKLMSSLDERGDGTSMIPTLQTLPPDDDMSDHTSHNRLNEGEEIYVDEDEEEDEDDEDDDEETNSYDNRHNRYVLDRLFKSILKSDWLCLKLSVI